MSDNNWQNIADDFENASSEGGGWIGPALKIGAVLAVAAVLIVSGDGAEASEIVSEAFRK